MQAHRAGRRRGANLVFGGVGGFPAVLTAQIELLDNFVIRIKGVVLEVVEKFATAVGHHDEAAT